MAPEEAAGVAEAADAAVATAEDAMADEAIAEEAMAEDAIADEAIADEAMAEEAIADDAIAEDAISLDAISVDAAAGLPVTAGLDASAGARDGSAATWGAVTARRRAARAAKRVQSFMVVDVAGVAVAVVSGGEAWRDQEGARTKLGKWGWNI